MVFALRKIGKYELKRPVFFDLTFDKEDRVFCFENAELELYSCGSTLEEAMKNLEVVFEALIEEYLLEADECLSESALKLKRKLEEFIDPF